MNNQPENILPPPEALTIDTAFKSVNTAPPGGLYKFDIEDLPSQERLISNFIPSFANNSLYLRTGTVHLALSNFVKQVWDSEFAEHSPNTQRGEDVYARNILNIIAKYHIEDLLDKTVEGSLQPRNVNIFKSLINYAMKAIPNVVTTQRRAYIYARHFAKHGRKINLDDPAAVIKFELEEVFSGHALSDEDLDAITVSSHNAYTITALNIGLLSGAAYMIDTSDGDDRSLAADKIIKGWFTNGVAEGKFINEADIYYNKRIEPVVGNGKIAIDYIFKALAQARLISINAISPVYYYDPANYKDYSLDELYEDQWSYYKSVNDGLDSFAAAISSPQFMDSFKEHLAMLRSTN